MWATFYSIENVGTKGKEWVLAWSLPRIWSLILLLGYMPLEIKSPQVSRMLLFPITDGPSRSRESLFHSAWEAASIANWLNNIEHRRKRKTISCHKQSFAFNLWSNFIFYHYLNLCLLKSKTTTAQMAWLQVKIKLYFVWGFVWVWKKETLRAIRILRLIQTGSNDSLIYISHGSADYRVIYINVNWRCRDLGSDPEPVS